MHVKPTNCGSPAPTFDEFAPTPYEEWRKVVEVSQGAPFEKRLVTKTYENIDLQPMYRQEDICRTAADRQFCPVLPLRARRGPLGYVAAVGMSLRKSPAERQPLSTRPCAPTWRVAKTVNLVLDRPTLAGIDADQAEADDVGKGACPSPVSTISLRHWMGSISKARLFHSGQHQRSDLHRAAGGAGEKQGKSLAKMRGAIGMDPLGQLARDGRLPRDLDGIHDVMAQLAAWAKANAPQLQTITVQGSPYHNGGASATQELAFALATAVEYLRAMQAAD